MPVILTGEAGDAWLRAPIEEALALQPPAPDDLLRTVTGGDKTGDPAQAPAAGVCSKQCCFEGPTFEFVTPAKAGGQGKRWSGCPGFPLSRE